jgi:hypothetical protein
MRDQLTSGEDFGHRRARSWKCEPGGRSPLPFLLEKGVCKRGQHDMAMPAVEGPAFEMVESEFGLDLLVLLLDGPSLMHQLHERFQRRGLAVALV